MAAWLLAMLAALTMAACQAGPGGAAELPTVPSEEVGQETASSENGTQEDTGGPTMEKIEITVGSSTFSAELYGNASAQALAGMLPLTVTLDELNGNEKYHYLPESLPTAAGRPDAVRAGDLMLFGSDCLVLFYEDFSTSYSYTPLGRITDPSGLAEAVGQGSVTLTIQAGENRELP